MFLVLLVSNRTNKVKKMLWIDLIGSIWLQTLKIVVRIYRLAVISTNLISFIHKMNKFVLRIIISQKTFLIVYYRELRPLLHFPLQIANYSYTFYEILCCVYVIVSSAEWIYAIFVTNLSLFCPLIRIVKANFLNMQ